MNILPDNIQSHVKLALKEDMAGGDVTADLIPESQQSTATIICRDNATITGTAWVDEVFLEIDKTITIEWQCKDGDRVKSNQVLCTLSGSSRSLLSGERVALNFLQTLSATATQTQKFVDILEGTKTKILDTRKTIPNLRQAQKYAVLCGGGKNHRIGLYDMILIKENHIMASGSILKAVEQAKKLHPTLKIEVEAENLDEFRQASSAGVDIIMLDNFDLKTMSKAVVENAGKVSLEASGGVTLETVRAIAETGVNFISVGAITKDIKAVDLSMRFKDITSN